MEHAPTEYFAGGTLLYIANHLSSKTRSDLNITFVEMINPKKSSIIVGGTICRHSNIDVTEFNNILTNLLIKKLIKNKKKCFF